MLGLSYNIVIHDPKFYHLLPKPLIFPRIWRGVRADLNNQPGHYEFFYISVTKYHLLDREDQPCEEEEEEYHFLRCVKTSQARRVGCRPVWDSWSSRDIPLCQTMDQLEEHEKLDLDLAFDYDKKMVLKKTGCKVPCKYKVCINIPDWIV